VIVAELEFRDVQRQIFADDFVEAADDPALEDAPLEPFRIYSSHSCHSRPTPDLIRGRGRESIRLRGFLDSLPSPRNGRGSPGMTMSILS